MLDCWQFVTYGICSMIQGIIIDTPPQDGVTIGYSNLGSKKFCPLTRQRCRQEVSHLILCIDMMNMKSTLLDNIMNKMQINLNVLHPRMLNRIETQMAPKLSQRRCGGAKVE
jgi:hypothetical protein